MAAQAGTDIGYYTLPVILSFEGIEKSVNTKLGKAFGDIGKKGAKQVADATEADLKRAGDAYLKLRNRAEDALGKVRVEEEKLAKARAGGKTDQIVAAEERLNKARRDSRAATDAARRSYDDLQDSQRRLGDGTRSLGDRFGGLGDMAGKAGQALTAAGVVAAGAALAGIAALGAGVVVAGRELYNLGQAWDDVTDSIAVRTGKLGPDLDKLKNAVKDLAPSTASSIGQIGDVVGSVSQALRLSGSDLTAVSKTITDLNRITGENLNVREFGKVIRGFGVDAADQVPTLNALFQASTATGISVNELVSAIVAAGPSARTLGLDLTDTASLLATFNEAGINGEAALKGLAIAAKQLAKDGREPAQGLRETVTELEGLLRAGREVDAVNLAAKFFGRGYAPFLDAIRSGALDAQSLNDALAGGGATIDEVAQSTADWTERWQQLKNTLSVALEPLATGVFATINAQLDKLADWVTNNQSKVVGLFGQVADFAFLAAKAVVQFAADSLRTLGELIKGVSDALRPVFDALATIGGVAKFIPGFNQIGDAMEKIGKAGQKFDDAFAGVPGNLDKAAGALEQKVLPALDKGQEYASAYIKRTQEATRFSEILGDTIATLENGQILISDNSPELEQKLTDLGLKVEQLPDGKFRVLPETDEGDRILDAWIDNREGKPIEIKVGADITPAQRAIGSLGGATLTVPVMPGGLGGVGGGPMKFASDRRAGSTGPEAGLTENSVNAKRLIEGSFPAIKNIGGYRPPDVTPFGTFTEHSSGEAIDVMIPNWTTPAGKAYGDQIAQWALANADALGTEWVIWQQKTYYPDGRVSPMGDRGNPTQNHYDHVHLKTKPGAVPSSMRRYGPGGAKQSPATPGMSPDQGIGMLQEPNGATAAAPMSAAIDTSRLYGAPAGMGATAGYNEMGEAGYYTPDNEKITQAQQRVDDAEEAIRRADARVAQAEASQAELDYTASESQRLAASESVRQAKYEAQKSVRERDDALRKLADAQKGDFTKAREAGRSAMGGGGQLGGLGSIASSFLGETFGIGSWLPALDNLWPLQMADTLIGAFMPSADGGTSSAPFGIPDIAAPPMPAGNQHGMGGMPGPIQNITVDNSQNFNNSPVGWDPAQTQKVQQQNAFRAPRLPVGMGS